MNAVVQSEYFDCLVVLFGLELQVPWTQKKKKLTLNISMTNSNGSITESFT